MKDGGRISAAIDVIADIEARRRPVTDALKDWGLSHRFAGSGDRIAIGNLVYDVLRSRASLAHVMGSDAPRALVLAAYGRVWGKGLDGLSAALDDRHAPAPLDETETAALSRPDPLADAPGDVAADVPEWLAASFERALGPDWIAEGRALAERAPIDLRVNRLKGQDRAKLLDLLSHFSVAPTPLSELGIRVAVGSGAAKPPHVQSELAFGKGLFEIQDEGSQIAALTADARPGEQVIDLCAGAGGKSLALAGDMAGKGQIYAYDADKRRFADIRERIERAGARNVQLREARGKPPAGVTPPALADLEGRADLVVVDAPCTGTGTWRRRPDAKWRVTENALATRTGEQDAVLAEAVDLVRPGGRLVYVTCSLLPQENEDRIAAFLAAHADFRLEAPTRIGEPGFAERLAPYLIDVAGRGPALRLTPKRAGTDGFFVARLRRAG